jgi:hypothetical protein
VDQISENATEATGLSLKNKNKNKKQKTKKDLKYLCFWLLQRSLPFL